ncbi:MAG: PH domain-containing protein [Candidatus Micrarchaeota archaeon]
MAVLQKIHTSGRMMYAKAVLIALIAAFAWAQIEKFLRLNYAVVYPAIAAFAILIIIVAFVRSRLQSLEITDEGVTSRLGIINVKTQFIPYSKIDSVNVSRTVFDRIFMLGTLRIDTLASIGTETVMSGIPSRNLEEALKAIQSRIHPGGRSEGVPPYRR